MGAVQQLAFLSAYQAASAATQSNSNHLAAAAVQVQAANKYDNDIAGGSNFDRNLAAMMIARAQQQQQHQQSYAQMNNVESNDRGPSPAANSKQSSHMLTAPLTVPSPPSKSVPSPQASPPPFPKPQEVVREKRPSNEKKSNKSKSSSTT